MPSFRRGATAALIAVGVTLPSGLRAEDDPPPRVHDPSTIVKHGDEYWIFATGVGVSSIRSRDLVNWESGPAVFRDPPAWITEIVPTQRGHFWAPDVIHHNGRYLLYYSVSAFGKQTSAIALATNSTLDPDDPAYKWSDEGIVIRSDQATDYNAIDPAVIRGDECYGLTAAELKGRLEARRAGRVLEADPGGGRVRLDESTDMISRTAGSPAGELD